MSAITVASLNFAAIVDMRLPNLSGALHTYHIDIYYNSQFEYKWDRRDREVWERVSIQKQNRPVQVVLTAWQRAAGGYTSADAPNVGELAAAITLQANMPQNTTRALAIPLSRASSTGRIGSMITAQEISLPGPSYQAPTPIPWTNPCLDQLDGCLQNGNRSLMNRVWANIYYKKRTAHLTFYLRN